ncbi:nucleotidyltransferase family protein [Wenzhouxiangella sp. AB-CW3]|uniref:N-acetylmuramate alpha-1-phosphate uridylyltransferase MurU n=1 Tax=Wenzhouxiangella sp. AB-CW3 TaxID=2771012 RepID=UPI00168BB72A|nr:nucleotidyltransferase family protein [Wenzhouxiangella sp. AB-CW3]QOC24250.1 nucleotidyltransferase family protein [Wenzhouxiangella sp. AB-CW3]
MKAMILAAGRGERLRPLTDSVPKPLLEVGGKPLIVHHLDRLAAAGFQDVVINLGWLGEQIAAKLGDGGNFGLRIRYSPEPPGALETAGGIVHALELLGDAPFLAISADVLCDYPLKRMRQLESEALAHLVMVDNPPHHPHGDFGIESGRMVLDSDIKLTFSGIAWFRPGLFADLEPGVRPLRPVLEQAIAAGLVEGERFQGQWFDTGTAGRLEAARNSLA